MLLLMEVHMLSTPSNFLTDLSIDD